MSRDIPNTNEIQMYMHCGQCLKMKPPGVSPRDWGQLEVGATALGMQVWCKRCEINVLHVDYEGVKHPATMDRQAKLVTRPVLYAYIGMEERTDHPQRVGLKQGITPAGVIPLVVMDFHRDRLDNPLIVDQLQEQADKSRTPIQLARFTYAACVTVIEPRTLQ